MPAAPRLGHPTSLAAAEVPRLDSMIGRLQRKADAMIAHAELPKADRHRGGRVRRLMG